MLREGEPLPEFQACDQDGTTVTSKDFAGKKLVLFFYPMAGTPTCTVEACNLALHYAELKKAGFEIVGVSADSIKKQKNFQLKCSLPFSLIADPDKDIINKFGVWQEKTIFGKTYMGIVRTTFIFNEDGICIKVISKVKSKEAAAQILAEI